MGIGANVESIVVQAVTSSTILHLWQIFTSVNFPKQHVLQQITNVTEFKPLDDKKGVITSLEEWALHILKSEQEV
jgi:hypothetical protein